MNDHAAGDSACRVGGRGGVRRRARSRVVSVRRGNEGDGGGGQDDDDGERKKERRLWAEEGKEEKGRETRARKWEIGGKDILLFRRD